MSATLDCDVLVVGVGPVGASLALLLAGEGARVLAADRATGVYPLPRAAHIDGEVVRVFQAIGAAEGVMAASRPAARYDFLSAKGEVLLRFDRTGEATPAGWPASNMIHQPSLEGALRERLGAAARVDLREGWTLTALEPEASGVCARFAVGTQERQVRARYVVGCDGARSATRDHLGVELDDLKFDEPWLVIDALVTDPSRLPQVNLQICDPARPTTCVMMGAGRHRWEFMVLPGETPEAVSDPDFVRRLLEPWNVEGAVTLERSAVYRFHALVAKDWRKGRVFLAGDAAHQTPPFAGQGLCAGIRDAANLSWKLGAVLRGDADDRILGTYQSEREPHVRSFIDLALMMGRTVCITDPNAAAARDAAMTAARAAGGPPPPALSAPPLRRGLLLGGAPRAGDYFPQPVAAGGARFDEAAGRGAWLLVRGPAQAADGLTVLSIDEDRLAPFAEPLALWLEATGREAVLVRPDRYVFGAGAVGELVDAWRRALGPAS